MPLCTPRIVAPVSSWSRTLLIEAALPGAQIEVRENGLSGRVVASGAVGGGRDRLPLLGGVTLAPGARLFVKQQDLADASGWTNSNVAVSVGWPPADYGALAPLWIRSRVFTCSRALWIAGAFPGAEVTVFDSSGAYGSGAAEEGNARLRLTQPLPASQVTIQVRQQAPAGAPVPAGPPPKITASVQALPVPRGSALPAPVIGEPMPIGCDTMIVIRNIVDGAEVTIARPDEGIVERALFDLEALSQILQTRLDPNGGRLTVFQKVGPRCGVGESPRTTVGFPPAMTPPVPRPLPPCGGSPFLYVEELKPGAAVTIDVNGTPFRATAPTVGTSHTFELAPIPVGAAISVAQSACGLTSAAGSTTASTPQFVEPPRIAEPLFKCARVVRVFNMTPGSFVRVIARGPAGETELTPFVFAKSSTIALDVNPYLIEGDHILAEVVRCGGPPIRSVASVRVEPLPELQPVRIVFAFATQRHVTVEALPGAFVRIFVSRNGNQEIGSGHVDPHSGWVPTTEPLRESESVHAVQYICGLETHPGPAVQVREGEKVFHLPAAKTWPVTSEPAGRDVIWLEGHLTCRVDGSYAFFAKFHNKAEESVADLEARVEVTLASGFPFGAVVRILLASDDKNDPSNKVYLQKGYLAEDSDTTTGVYLPFRNPPYWHEVLAATAKWEWVVALQKFPETDPDNADEPEKQKKPPPSG
jgi:hypothetical protein